MWRPDDSVRRRKRRKGRRQAPAQPSIKKQTKNKRPLPPISVQLQQLEKTLASTARNVLVSREQYRKAIRDREAKRWGNAGSYETATHAIAIAEKRLRNFESQFQKAQIRIRELSSENQDVQPGELGVIDPVHFGGAKPLLPSAADLVLPVPVPSEQRTLRDDEVVYFTREGQIQFRDRILDTYKKCAITGCEDEGALQAAHIIPYVDNRSHLITNGLCLRADLHCLFDRGLIWVDHDYVVHVSTELKFSGYRQLDGRTILLPAAPDDWPDKKLLAFRLQYL